MTNPTRKEQQREALNRAQAGLSAANYDAIFDGFIEKGIPLDQIKPRENIFTFQAWRALGRTVTKGQHGVKITTWITCQKKDAESDQDTYRRPKTATVFHISQTAPLEETK